MNGFGLLCGHLIGDYILQNDWMAANKVVWGDKSQDAWAWKVDNMGHLACTVHCLCYTFAVALFSFWWMPWWGYLVTFLTHWPIDRFRLAKWWMIHVSGQKGFATGPLAPWSFIIVDNIWHLVTLFVIGVIAKP